MHLNPVLVQNLSGVTTILKSAVIHLCQIFSYNTQSLNEHRLRLSQTIMKCALLDNGAQTLNSGRT